MDIKMLRAKWSKLSKKTKHAMLEYGYGKNDRGYMIGYFAALTDCGEISLADAAFWVTLLSIDAPALSLYFRSMAEEDEQ